jgi:hypothetical protein
VVALNRILLAIADNPLMVDFAAMVEAQRLHPQVMRALGRVPATTDALTAGDEAALDLAFMDRLFQFNDDGEVACKRFESMASLLRG